MQNLINLDRKRILVLDGGGEKGAFQLGVMMGLYEQGIDHSFFDYYVCTSSGAFNSAYFLAGQFEQAKQNWLNHLPEMFWKTFSNDMHALDKILKVVSPLDCNRIKSIEQKVIIALANIETRKVDYICLNDEEDIIKALLATCAMPFYAKPTELHGKLYYDGGLIGQPQIEKAQSLDPNAEIWVIMMEPAGFRLNEFVWKIISWLPLFNLSAKNLLAKYPRIRNKILTNMENDHKLKVIQPKSTLPIGYRSRNKRLIEKCYDLGKVQAREFLKNYEKLS